jgi:two-component system OmpR family response regulator
MDSRIKGPGSDRTVFAQIHPVFDAPLQLSECPPMSMLTVLYVDDDLDICEVAALSLKLDGTITPVTAESGEKALELLDAGLQPDAIMLDVMMPDLDGPTTLKIIRERPHLRDVPVVFITARTMASEHADYMALGAKGVLTKPFDPITLARRLRDVLGRV